MTARLLLTVWLFPLLFFVSCGPSVANLLGPEAADMRMLFNQIPSQAEFRIDGEPVFLPAELLQFYRARNFQPVWMTASSTGRKQISEVLSRLESSQVNGLCADDYHLGFFRDLFARFNISGRDADSIRLRWNSVSDLLLTDALLHYVRHLIDGLVPADAVQEGWDLRKQSVDLVAMVEAALATGDPETLLRSIQPTHSGYLALQKILERYREIEAFGGWPSIAPGPTLRPGMADERVLRLRTRLLLSGDLVELEKPPDHDVALMSDADTAALKRFQRRHGLYPDGILGEKTLAALNVPVSKRVRQIELNMERWRWLPHSLGEKFLLVNIADFRVSVVDGGKTVLSMSAVVGNRFRKTPVFSAPLEYLEFSPYWYVPPTILEEDKLPHIKADPEYLEKHHFEIVSWDRKRVIDRQTIDWSLVDVDTFPGLLRQKPGPWNALGRIKFMLPNRHAIYLHDTNDRGVFSQRDRLFSSGCIRLKDPVGLAVYLLADQDWSEERVRMAMAAEQPQRLYLQEPLPVHILYWTAWVDDDGQINFREDVYGRDRDLQQAFDQASFGCRLNMTTRVTTELP